MSTVRRGFARSLWPPARGPPRARPGGGQGHAVAGWKGRAAGGPLSAAGARGAAGPAPAAVGIELATEITEITENQEKN